MQNVSAIYPLDSVIRPVNELAWSICGLSPGIVHVTIIRLTFSLFVFLYLQMLISLGGHWCGFECRVSKFPLCASSYFHLYFVFVFLRWLLSVNLFISFIHLVFVAELEF